MQILVLFSPPPSLDNKSNGIAHRPLCSFAKKEMEKLNQAKIPSAYHLTYI